MRKTGILAVVCAAAMAASAETVVDVTGVGEKEKTSVSINVTGQGAAAYAATLKRNLELTGCFVVRGDGFLYKQVRSMVGFLITVGKGNERPEAVKELLEAATPRTARVETAPARGLFLWKVFY